MDTKTIKKINEAQVEELFTTDEPQILFLGTASTKATGYRGASAIYYFGKDGGVLMDAAEGSFGQLWDHFNDKAKVDEVLLKTRAIFITHMHGDHCIGIGKIMHERDHLVTATSDPVYIVIPQTIWDWVDNIRS